MLTPWLKSALLRKPNLVQRKISLRLPVRLNHFPMSSSLSP